jgi:transcriptional regulator with GAF, ATPase, and Fis domain
LKIDKNEFLAEVTKRICGSLNIEKGLGLCLLYVRDVLPADELMLTVYDPVGKTLDICATADDQGGTLRSEKIPIPPHLRPWLEEFAEYPRMRLLADASQDEIVRLIAEKEGWPDSSFVIGRLIVDNTFIGSLIVRANGKAKYRSRDIDLWSSLNEPAAIALANSRKYLELIRLKELLTDDNRFLQDELRKRFDEQIVGADFGLRDVMHQVLRVAPSASPVLLIGETGTGKELIANSIHKLSPRNRGPLIPVNCGAIPDSLIDSELFGHEKGAFTGALTQKKGKFERANNGTIFLDEVSELPANAQVRLLRVLQEKEIERVGGSSLTKVDIRVISATNKDLKKLVERGLFRDDLYYRLAVFPITMPALRERREDIPALVEHFFLKISREMGLRHAPKLSKTALEIMMEYDWPGNVRELSNVVERAVILYGENPIPVDDIPVLLMKKETLGESLMKDEKGQTLNAVESAHIRHVMKMTGGKVEGRNGAASILGLKPSTLRNRMKLLAIPFGKTPKNKS